MGEQAWLRSEPPLTIGRGLTVATGAIGGLLAIVVLWTMLPTQAGRNAVGTIRSTVAGGLNSVFGSERTTVVQSAAVAPPITAPRTTTVAPNGPSNGTSTTRPSADQLPPVASTATQQTHPVPTYAVNEGISVEGGSVAVAVNGGSLIITTAAAVNANLTVDLVLPDGTPDTARVLFVDANSGLAVLSPASVRDVTSYTVSSLQPGDELTVLANQPHTVTVAADGSVDLSWKTDDTMSEGVPVVNQHGQLVALCSHDAGGPRLVRLSNLDDLQQAMTTYTGTAKVWLGIALNDDPTGAISIGAVDPAGPAASAGLVSGDVILTVNGTALTDGQQLIDLLGTHAPGDVVQFGVRHEDGTVATLSVTLGAPKTTL